MTSNEWKYKIIDAMKSADTYRPYFDAAIDTLSGILEKRDNAQAYYEKMGGNVIVKHTNKAGATNIEQNPTLRLINDLNRDALAYWRDLGLTPAGLRRINEAAMKTKRKSTLGEALKGIG